MNKSLTMLLCGALCMMQSVYAAREDDVITLSSRSSSCSSLRDDSGALKVVRTASFCTEGSEEIVDPSQREDVSAGYTSVWEKVALLANYNKQLSQENTRLTQDAALLRAKQVEQANKIELLRRQLQRERDNAAEAVRLAVEQQKNKQELLERKHQEALSDVQRHLRCAFPQAAKKQGRKSRQ